MADLAILILRITLGIVWIPHGVHKLRKLEELNVKWAEIYGYPVGTVALNGIVQVVCGLAVLVGAYGRIAASILLVSMLVATYVSIYNHREPFLSTPEGKGWDLNLLLIGAMIAVILLGDGKWSLIA